MLVNDIITDARRELLEYGAQLFWSDAELLRLYNRAELDFVNRTRLLEDTAFLSLQQGISQYPLPSNWLSSRAVLHKAVNSSGTVSWRRVWPKNLEKIVQERPNFLDTSTTAQGRPVNYMVWNKEMYIFPAPDLESTTQINLFYKSKPLPITNPATESVRIDDSLSEGLTAYILWKAWAKEKETDLAEEQKAIYFNYVGEGRRWSKKQLGDGRYQLDIESNEPFGGDYNPYSPLS